jgi:predicted GNAT family N-acyltransferase
MKEPLGAKTLKVAVVRTVDDLMQVFAVRAQVCVTEQDCPYVEEFDGVRVLADLVRGDGSVTSLPTQRR